MNNLKEFESKRNQFVTLLSQMDAALVDYVGALKAKSSEELLNGSTAVAKNYLEEVLLLETNTSEFARLIKNIVNFIHKSDGSVADTAVDSAPEIAGGSVPNVAGDSLLNLDISKNPDNTARMKTESPKSINGGYITSEEIGGPESTYVTDNVNLIEDQDKILEKQIKKNEVQEEKIEEQVQKIKKKTIVYDPKIPILKSLIYLGGIANEEEIVKYMKQYNGRNGDKSISIDELKISLDLMYENEMISVDPLDENIEILQSGIDYLACNEV